MFQALRARSSRAGIRQQRFPLATAIQSLQCEDSDIFAMHQPDADTSGLPLCVAWPSRSDAKLAVGYESGIIAIMDVAPTRAAAGLIAPRSCAAHPNAINALTFGHDDSHLTSASADHRCRVWDVATLATVYEHSGHTAAVKCLTHCHYTDTYLSGARDGTAMLWDTRSVEPHITLCLRETRKRSRSSSLSQTSSTVTSVKFIGCQQVATSVSSSPLVTVWDRRNSSHPLYELGSEIRGGRYYGVIDMDVSTDCHSLVASVTNDTIYSYSLSDRHCVSEYRGHSASYYQKLSISRDNQFVATTSKEGGIFVYQHRTIMTDDRPQCHSPLTVLLGHSEESGAVAWSHTETALLASASDDETVRVWRSGTVDTDTVTNMVMDIDSAMVCVDSGDKENEQPDLSLPSSPASSLSSTSPVATVESPLTDQSNRAPVRTRARRDHTRGQGMSLLPFLTCMPPQPEVDTKSSAEQRTQPKRRITLRDHWLTAQH